MFCLMSDVVCDNEFLSRSFELVPADPHISSHHRVDHPCGVFVRAEIFRAGPHRSRWELPL
ncbi:hypothetical protein VT84_04965 [Gemmata sp. SH-PL17]|nr:hypothetical protein VT84_04965 [Gemmata sp. SH-PL17]